RRVGGVDDLVAAGGEPSEQAVEVALRLRTEVELRLLDQEHEPADSEGAAVLERSDDREGGRGRRRSTTRPQLLRERALEDLEGARRLSVAGCGFRKHGA